VDNKSLQDKDRILIHKQITTNQNNFQRDGLWRLGAHLMSDSPSAKLLRQMAEVTNPDVDRRASKCRL